MKPPAGALPGTRPLAQDSRRTPPRFESFCNVRDRGATFASVTSPAISAITRSPILLPLIEKHDRKAFEIFCYSTGSLIDDHTRAIEKRADAWRMAAAMSAAELADTINRDASTS
jgi:hypothetical protein